ncbi:MAG TPA: hypothetical protein VNE82_05085 [Candidatus Binataceae bacterium]|nr:hypothetical protein [Candidatus Binataceae bacterium]
MPIEPRFILHASLAHDGRDTALARKRRAAARAVGASKPGGGTADENFRRKLRREPSNRLIVRRISLSWKVRRTRTVRPGYRVEGENSE